MKRQGKMKVKIDNCEYEAVEMTEEEFLFARQMKTVPKTVVVSYIDYTGQSYRVVYHNYDKGCWCSQRLTSDAIVSA